MVVLSLQPFLARWRRTDVFPEPARRASLHSEGELQAHISFRPIRYLCLIKNDLPTGYHRAGTVQ